MSRSGRIARGVLIGAALVAALAPRPAALVERLYASGVYPSLQFVLTSASNAAPIAIVDVAIVLAVVAAAAWGRRVWRDARRAGVRRTLTRAALGVATAAAFGYLWFLLAWGLNYSRPPIDVRLDLPRALPTAADVRALLDEAVAGANAGYLAAHAGPDDRARDEQALARLLAATDARDGRARSTVPGRPKPTLLAPYFRMAGVDGLTAPVALETLLNPDLTAMERPFTLAHEWAHLAGHAPEADASFVAWQIVMQPGADAVTRYSGWLFLLSETASQLSGDDRRAGLAALGDGPRRDLADIARRQAQRVDVVERLGWRVYDSYLKSQGVSEGVRSYSRVVELIVRARRRAPPAAMPVPQ